MWWKRLSLRTKMFVAILVATTLIVLAMAVMVGLSMRAGVTRYLVQAEINRFDTLETALAQNYDTQAGGWPSLTHSRRAWRDFVGMNTRPHGAPAERPPASAERTRGRPPPPFGPGSDPLRLAGRITLLDADGQVVTRWGETILPLVIRPIMPIGEDEGREPLGWIGLSAPFHAAGPADAAFLWGQLRSLLLASVLALVLSALVALFLARQFLAPVKALAEGTAALAAGNTTIRLPNERMDELGILIDRYNTLAQSLADAAAAERRWITDTSHDLQTPLAVLRAEIEALQDGVRQPTRATLDGLHHSVMRLSALVNDLNTLARTREGGFSLIVEDTDLAAIIAEAAEALEGRIDNAGLGLANTAMVPLWVRADRQRMRQLLDNLLENARRYTAAPGQIQIAANLESEAVTVTIEDTAPCPPADTIERLFERFFRVEPSRSQQHGGSGLGLAIALAIVEAHGGTIRAQASRLGGLAMIFTIPSNHPQRGHRSHVTSPR